MLKPGLYEQVINEKIDAELADVSEDCKTVEKIDKAEASDILTQYIAGIVRQSMDTLSEEKDNINAQVKLANKIIKLIRDDIQDPSYQEYLVGEKAEQLLALLSEDDPDVTASGKKAKDIPRPETSIAASSLFTGAIHEPQMFSELKKEIATANRIDMLISFVKWSGLRLIINELEEFTQRGGKLRIITTSYMGATDIKAVEELEKLLNTTIKVSYDTESTRLHAKAYIFYRETGFTTAYVGSSNLSNAAISSGLEWNVKVTEKDLPDTIKKIDATFESYWNSSDFELYQEEDHERLEKALKAEKYQDVGDKRKLVFDIMPYPFQQEILDRLQAEREIRGLYRNLVCAATGTGKTVISAFDYANFCKKNRGMKNRLLFVAHREEILRQSMDTYRGVLQNPNFGELYYKDSHPEEKDYLFASISSINSQELCGKLPEDYYDFIVVDEFHHAAAPSYQQLLSYFKPKILLGLTATPERMDGKDVLTYFNNKIAAEIRLPEAIDRKLLCPFQYFGVSDTVDLSEVRWTRGGYDKSELSKVYSLNRKIAEKRANHIIRSMEKYVTEMDEVKGLGFCVSIEHARFMAEYFNKRGIPSICLSSQSEDEERLQAKKKLVNGEIRIIFVVDLYNEGVDIREVNTVLFLRPTESLTVFLQQLGRGLRLSPEKECLTVLDFIGQANKRYNFEDKFAALLSNTKHSVSYELKKGFISVPKGCYIQLEKIASKVVLDNIRQGFGTKVGLLAKIEDYTEEFGEVPTVAQFLQYHHMGLETIYKKYCFSRLLAEAGVTESFDEPLEEELTKAFSRLASIDSRRWLKFLIEMLDNIKNINFNTFTNEQKRFFQMFYITIWMEPVSDWNGSKMQECIRKLVNSPIMLTELKGLLQYNYERIDFIDLPSGLPFECPLDVHCNYTRDQLFVALDYMSPNNIREGVKWLPEKNVDVLLVTLNKSDKDYSPTTMYEDYSINSKMFHWQSQSTTSAESVTGQRYINHKKQGSKVCLFVREFKTDELGTSPYTFLGMVNYMSHTGSRPMNIVWNLENEIPAKYLKKTNKLVVG